MRTLLFYPRPGRGGEDFFHQTVAADAGSEDDRYTFPAKSVTPANRRQTMMRLVILSLVVALTWVFAAGAAPPNIVLILADDLGWRDLGCYGSTFYETPHVDALARRGMRFTNFYAANPLCSPTRASILTGQYPGRLRFTTPAGHLRKVVLDPALPRTGPPTRKAVTPATRTRLPLEYHTLAEALKAAGYATGHFGKWHLGWDPYGPKNQGFDVNFPGGSYPGPPHGYFSPHNVPEFEDGLPGEHIEDRTAAEAIRFLEAHKDRPFFLNYWMFSVHAPFQAKEKLIARYRKKADPKNPQRCPTMGGMIHTMDACVGKVLAALDRLGLADNTLVIFTSDNGGNMYSNVDGLPPTSNFPLRGGKAMIYEGGVRVPLIAVWPGKIRPGATSDALTSSIDFYPTLLEVAGAKGKPGQVVDGVGILPVLRGTGRSGREELFCHFPHYTPATGNRPATSVRRGDWKLIRFFADGPGQKDRLELYDLARDIGEKHDLAGEKPELAKELNARITRHLEETKALVPFPNPDYDPDAAATGWTGNRHARLARKGGALVVTATGNDPFLTTRTLPRAAGPYTFEFALASTGKGAGQVFWMAARRQGFRRERSMTFEIVHDGKEHTYAVKVPVKGTLHALRLDPGAGAGEMKFAWMRLKDGAGKVVKEWRFETPGK
jgi:arylsulfatase A-like enzyme